MAKSAYAFLNSTGVVVRVHSSDVGGAQPTTGPNDLESLIAQGYLASREVVLDGNAGVLVVLQKP